ncbi:MAG: hypothetical protein D6771_03600 [Zetaproteobacteria bacterium]|nr:MAG: hypothetical protein D6771_03600 [Zetaproteobacteria bacterium]
MAQAVSQAQGALEALSALSAESWFARPWFSLSGAKVSFAAELGKLSGHLLHIGTDAFALGKEGRAVRCRFVSVVCVHFRDRDGRGRGGRVFYTQHWPMRVASIWEKLFVETSCSVSLAAAIAERFPRMGDRLLVHIDANPDASHRSGDYVHTLANMVMGYGFRYVLKPKAWASSRAADFIARGQHLRVV